MLSGTMLYQAHSGTILDRCIPGMIAEQRRNKYNKYQLIIFKDSYWLTTEAVPILKSQA